MNLSSSERLSPLFFDGLCNSTISDELQESEEYLYHKMGIELDREHVKSGRYQERAVDTEFEQTLYRQYSRMRSKQRSPKPPLLSDNRTSTSSSDLEKCKYHRSFGFEIFGLSEIFRQFADFVYR